MVFGGGLDAKGGFRVGGVLGSGGLFWMAVIGGGFFGGGGGGLCGCGVWCEWGDVFRGVFGRRAPFFVGGGGGVFVRGGFVF